MYYIYGSVQTIPTYRVYQLYHCTYLWHEKKVCMTTTISGSGPPTPYFHKYVGVA